MTSDIVAATLAGLGPMIQSSQRKPLDRFADRRAYGNKLMLAGADMSPIKGGVVEGLARLGQGALGGYFARKADTEQLAEEDTQRTGLMDAISKAQTTGDFSAVARALAAANQPGAAASLMFADMAQRRQDQQGRALTGAYTGGPPPGGMPAPTGGAPGSYPDRVSATESPNGATNPQSGAVGFYQIMPDTIVGLAQQTPWGQGVPPAQLVEMVKADPAKQRDLMALYTRQSEATLAQAGLPVNDMTRFALHAFGPAGGVSLLKAPDNMPVAQWVSSVQWGRATPQQVMSQNGLDKYQTVGQLKQDFIARRIGGQQGQAQPPAAPVAAPPQPQMGAAPPVQGGSAPPDDSGDSRINPGFATGAVPPMQIADDGSADYARASRLLQLGTPDALALARQAMDAADKKRMAAQQRRDDQTFKPPSEYMTPGGNIGVTQGGQYDPERIRREAAARAAGGGEVEQFTGQDGQAYQRNLATGEVKPVPQASVTRTVPGAGGYPVQQDDTGKQSALPAPFNEIQGRAAGFADRMALAQRNLAGIEGQGTDAIAKFMSRLGDAGNWAQSDERQRYEQAQRAFINGLLRRESGAAIAPDEFTSYSKEFFPQPGDSPGVVAQKRLARDTSISSMVREAGPSYKPSGAAPAQPQSADPLPNHVEALRANPGLASQFDKTYGPGASARYLTGGR